jgi:hypothetical protein
MSEKADDSPDFSEALRLASIDCSGECECGSGRGLMVTIEKAEALFDQHTEWLRQKHELLKRAVNESMSGDCGSGCNPHGHEDGCPMMVDTAEWLIKYNAENDDLRQENQELRARLEAAENASSEYIRRTDPILDKYESDHQALGVMRTRLEAAEKELARKAEMLEAVVPFLPSARVGMAKGPTVAEWVSAMDLVGAILPKKLCSPPICPGCKKEIDPDVCGCGGSGCRADWDGHSFVPQGCDCLRVKDENPSSEPATPKPICHGCRDGDPIDELTGKHMHGGGLWTCASWNQKKATPEETR